MADQVADPWEHGLMPEGRQNSTAMVMERQVAELQRIAVALERIATQMESTDRQGKGIFNAKPQ